MENISLNYNLRPPYKWRLFLFFFFSMIHIIILTINTVLFYFFYNKYKINNFYLINNNILLIFNFIIYVLFEFIFFMFFCKNNRFKIILRIAIISLLIFIVNIFFYEGKILFKFYNLCITEEGLVNSIIKSYLIITMFFFTINSIKSNRDGILSLILTGNKKNIFYLSIYYFINFWDLIEEKINLKKITLKIIRIYKKDKIDINKEKLKKIEINNSFYFYNILFYLLSIVIIIINILIIV